MAAAATTTTPSSTVLVTGANGFLGSWCVKKLLERGHVVHATARGTKAEAESKTKHLFELDGASADNLKVFAADLLVSGSFDQATEGCDVVLHTASPFYIGGAEYTKDKLLGPAVQGTRNVLESCIKVGSVKKVVVTSSTAAVYNWFGTKPKEHVMTEADWSDESKVEEKQGWYALSKIRAEREAWKIYVGLGGECFEGIESKETGSGREPPFLLCVMNPCLIFGPMLQPSRVNTSSHTIAKLFASEDDKMDRTIPNECKSIVDVRDVAEAHIRAGLDCDEKSEVWGHRVLLKGASAHWKEIAEATKKALLARGKNEEAKRIPEAVAQTLNAPGMGAPPPHPTLYSVARAAKMLSLENWITVQDMVDATVDGLVT